MYSSLTIAAHLVQTAFTNQQRISNSRLQCLTVFAHGWHLALKDAPLFYDPVMAWNYGPAIHELHESLRPFGNGFVDSMSSCETMDEFPKALVARAFEVYSSLTDEQVWMLAKRRGGPWHVSWHREHFSHIPNELFRTHYLRMRTS